MGSGGPAPPLGHWGRVWGDSSSRRKACQGFQQLELRYLGQLFRLRSRPPEKSGGLFRALAAVPGTAARAADSFPAIRGGETIRLGAGSVCCEANPAENWFVVQQTALAAAAVKQPADNANARNT